MVEETYYNNGLDAFMLKLLAIFGMTLDHIAIVFAPHLSLEIRTVFYACGGITFPIMAYLLVEGYKRTSSVKQYGVRLLGFAIIAYVPFSWAMGTFMFNVLFTLLLGLITLYLYDHMNSRLLFWFVFVGLTLLSVMMDWGLVGVPMVLMYYTVKGKWAHYIVPLAPSVSLITLLVLLQVSNLAAAFTDLLPQLAFFYIGGGMSVVLLKNYNGLRGRSLKYLFYGYYPAHLLMLAVIRDFVL
ncbi:TraX family protein [Enterococcus sp. AZ109]|uniref:TraX family protein n=1 Tax=Enterococcus sp. AZ109 TaxID=2774634 RepID=UPI003F200070